MPGLSKQKVLEVALLGQRACAFVTLKGVTVVPSPGSSLCPHTSAEFSVPGLPVANDVTHHSDPA